MNAKKILALLLALVLVLSLAACGGNDAVTLPDTDEDKPVDDSAATPDTPADSSDDSTDAETPAGTTGSASTLQLPGVPEAVYAVPDTVLPLTEDDVHFSYWCTTQAQMAQYGYNSADDWQVFREMRDRTGISVDLELVSDASTQFGIMMASGDWPDFIESFGTYYTSGYDHAVEEEVIAPLEEYEEYLPHLFAIVDSDEEIRRQATTDAGHIPGIPFLKISTQGKSEGPWCGYVIRQDWLDAQNLEKPTTYDELENVLTVFQQNYETAVHPLKMMAFGGNFMVDLGISMHDGYNIRADWMVKDGKVAYAPLTAEYRDYVAMLADWYQKGFMSDDDITGTSYWMDPSDSAKEAYGVFPLIYYNDEQLYEVNKDKESYVISALPVLTREKGGEVHVVSGTDKWATQAVITATSENVELICQYWDYLFSPDGILLSNYGLEGVNFNFDENGDPQWIKEAFESDDPLWTLQRFQYLNLLFNTPSYDIFDRETVMCAESSMENWAAWQTGWDDDYCFPASATMTAKDAENFGAIMGDISTYVTETIGKIVTGNASLDTWDDFIAGVNKMGIEEAIGYKQAALDRYNAR